MGQAAKFNIVHYMDVLTKIFPLDKANAVIAAGTFGLESSLKLIAFTALLALLLYCFIAFIAFCRLSPWRTLMWGTAVAYCRYYRGG